MKLILTIIYNFVPAIFAFIFFLVITIAPFVYFAGVTSLVVFIVLKFVGVIDWSWLWVLSPAWIGIAYFVLSLIFGSIFHHVRFTKVTSTETQWFEKHLNWTYVLAYLLWFVLNLYADESVVAWWLSLVAAILWLVISGWVIKLKGRSLWWLLLSWIGSPLWLKNRKRKPEPLNDLMLEQKVTVDDLEREMEESNRKTEQFFILNPRVLEDMPDSDLLTLKKNHNSNQKFVKLIDGILEARAKAKKEFQG